MRAKFIANLLIEKKTITKKDTPEEYKKSYMIYNKINAGRSYVKKLENNLKEDNDHPFKDVIITEIKEINNELEE